MVTFSTPIAWIGKVAALDEAHCFNSKCVEFSFEFNGTQIKLF